MDLDLGKRMIYWTDRDDPPRGNTVNRAPMDAKGRWEPEILVMGLHEAIASRMPSFRRRNEAAFNR